VDGQGWLVRPFAPVTLVFAALLAMFRLYFPFFAACFFGFALSHPGDFGLNLRCFLGAVFGGEPFGFFFLSFDFFRYQRPTFPGGFAFSFEFDAMAGLVRRYGPMSFRWPQDRRRRALSPRCHHPPEQHDSNRDPGESGDQDQAVHFASFRVALTIARTKTKAKTAKMIPAVGFAMPIATINTAQMTARGNRHSARPSHRSAELASFIPDPGR
jgi:hypothetical protein